MTRSRSRTILDKSHRADQNLYRQRPPATSRRGGSSAPVTNELLLRSGISYDHWLKHSDFEPYYVRVGDSWTKIDYSRKPRTNG